MACRAHARGATAYNPGKLGQFWGGVPRDTLDKALAAADYVAFEPFDVAFDRVEYSGGG